MKPVDKISPSKIEGESQVSVIAIIWSDIEYTNDWKSRSLFMRLLEFHRHNDSQLEGRKEEEEVEEEEEEEIDWV